MINFSAFKQKMNEKVRIDWETRMQLPFYKRVLYYSLPFTLIFCLGSSFLSYDRSWDTLMVIKQILIIIIGSIVFELILSFKSKD